MPVTDRTLETLRRSRYALLRTYRRDGTAVDTPIWLVVDDRTVLFRTKIGPKTRRIAARPDVDLVACDYRGRPTCGDRVSGRATLLTGTEARCGNEALHRRYGWQWNIVPVTQAPRRDQRAP